MLSTEELLKPRYLVIADYPNSLFAVGEILHEFCDTVSRYRTWYYAPEKDSNFYTETINYPHLFRPLQWWENRAIEDMPEYVWATSLISGKVGVFKIAWELINGEWYQNDVDIFGNHKDVTPATKQEFED